MALSAEKVEQFRTEGYTFVDPFFTDTELSALRSELGRMYATAMDDRSLNVALQADGEENSGDGDWQNLQLIPLNDKSPLYQALPFAPKVSDAVASLIGDSFRLHLDQAFWKPARQGIGTSWHQDNAYFKIADPLRGLAMWVAIHDATVENGTIHVIPREFGTTHEHYRDPLSNHHIRFDPENDAGVPIELKAGGVGFFCYGTPHCTKTNNTDTDRAGVALHFLHTDFAEGDHWTTHEERTPIVRGPQATGGLRECGHLIEGTWEQRVADANAAE
jgi:ectoine hydroxylase-related dioxygenase (phytanoyl-CoA dioxygenase family)